MTTIASVQPAPGAGTPVIDPVLIPYLLEGFANLAVAQGCLTRAIRLAGAAAPVHETIGAPHPPIWWVDFQRRLQPVHQALPEPAYAAAWAEGRAMTLAQAVEYALSGPSVQLREEATTRAASARIGEATFAAPPADVRALPAGQTVAAPPGPGALTPRELAVLRLIAAGRSSQEIAVELSLSVRTVERHITNLYGKLDVRNRAEATLYALRHGLG